MRGGHVGSTLGHVSVARLAVQLHGMGANARIGGVNARCSDHCCPQSRQLGSGQPAGGKALEQGQSPRVVGSLQQGWVEHVLAA